MSVPTTTRSWILREKPAKAVTLEGPSSTFVLETRTLPNLEADSVLVKTLYLSNDPAQRGWIQRDADPKRLYLPPPEEGDVMHSWGIGKVLKVGDGVKGHKVGDLVSGRLDWNEYALLKDSDLTKIESIPGLNDSVWLGALGLPAWTAYVGLHDIVKLQAGETLIVSGAAGAVGNLVVQYAKHVIGAKRVVAIAGSEEKCAWLKKIGADAAINYNNATFEQELKDAVPDYAEVFFDNVGGSILNAVLPVVKRFGRVVACGAIATYNDKSNSLLPNYFEIIANRLTVQGFVVLDHGDRLAASTAAFQKALSEGKVVVEGAETIVDIGGRFEEVPKVWHRLFEGKNTGKLITKVASE